MRRGKNVIGKDVLSFIDGTKTTSVKDIIIGRDNSTIVALLVDEGGLFGSAKVVPMENVASFGKDAVVISDGAAIMSADAVPALKEILNSDDKLLGKKVFTEGGDEQGSISDIYFEENSGEIVGFEVSGGLIENVQKGTSYLSADDVVNVGKDVILIKAEAAYSLEGQVGGVQGALEGAKAKASDAVDTAKAKASEAKENITEAARDKQLDFVDGKIASREVKADDGSIIVSEGQPITRQVAEEADRKGKLAALVAAAGGGALQGISEGIQQRGEDAAIGKRAGQDIEADDGTIIVASGQRINNNHVEEARGRGKLNALLASVGIGQAQETGDKVGAVAGQAGDRAGIVAGQATDKAGTLWDDFTRKFSDLTDSAGKRVDEEKTKKRLADIEDAIGRPVSKVILDKQDNVVLNLGDIITHEAVQRAHEADMLDTLLANVYKGEVDFSKEEMRVQEEAQATVDKASGNAAAIDDMRREVQQAEQQREEEKEQKRAEADQKRDRRGEERDQRDMQREQKVAQLDAQTAQDAQQKQAAPAQQSNGQSDDPAATRNLDTTSTTTFRPQESAGA